MSVRSTTFEEINREVCTWVIKGKFCKGKCAHIRIWMAKIRSKALIRIAADGCWRNKAMPVLFCAVRCQVWARRSNGERSRADVIWQLCCSQNSHSKVTLAGAHSGEKRVVCYIDQRIVIYMNTHWKTRKVQQGVYVRCCVGVFVHSNMMNEILCEV